MPGSDDEPFHGFWSRSVRIEAMTSRPLSLALALRCQSAIRGARRSLLVHSHQPVQTSRWLSKTCHPSIPTESPFSSPIYQLFCTFPAKRTRVPTWRRSDLATSSLEPTFNPCIWSTVICPPPTETGLQVATPLQLIFCLSTVAPSQRGVSSHGECTAWTLSWRLGLAE